MTGEGEKARQRLVGNVRTVFLLTALVVGSLAQCGCTAGRTREQAPARAEQPATLTPEQMSQDVDLLVDTILDVHPEPYAYTGPRTFESAVAQVRQEIRTPLAIDEFHVKVSRLVAQIQDGHTRIFPPKRWDSRLNDGRVFPILLHNAGGVVCLIDHYGDGEAPVGRRVISIEGEPATRVVERCVGVFPCDGCAGDDHILEDPGSLWYALGAFYGRKDTLTLEIQTAPDRVESHTVTAVPVSDAYAAHRRARPPKTSSEVPLKYVWLPDLKCGSMRIYSFGDCEGVRFGDVLKEAFADMKARGAKSLIIDVRGCPGGSDSQGVMLLGYLTGKPYRLYNRIERRMSSLYCRSRGVPQVARLFTGRMVRSRSGWTRPRANPLRFNGQVYVMIDSQSFSSAVTFASAMKAQGLGKLVGESPKGLLNGYGETVQFVLPNSRLRAQASSAHFLEESAGGSYARPLMPDYPVRPSVEDLVSGRDPAAEFVLKLVRTGMQEQEEPAQVQR